MSRPIDDLDAAETLRRSEAAISKRRAADIEDLELVAHWADLHGDEPLPRTVNGRPVPGGDRLVQLGGEGTPQVRELTLHELAIARGTHPLATRSATADVLDLRHRLIGCWMVFRSGACDAWVVRKLASMTRHLTLTQAAEVDVAVADVLATRPASRILRLAEAAIIEADPAGHAAAVEEALRTRYVGLSPSDEHGLRTLFARIEAGDAAWIEALVDRLADLLIERPDLRPDLFEDLPDGVTKDELRAVTFGLLAHPDEVLDLLARSDDPDEELVRRRPRPRAVVYVHLHRAAVTGNSSVANVEDLGPMLLDQLRRLLRHAHIDVHPVIDLTTDRAVDGHDHPADMAHRTRLRNPVEVFPYATRGSRHTDSDHPNPYRPHGPPGQTRDSNLGPLGRTSHRAKTHLAYRVRQTGLDTYEWTTPHGLVRIVDPSGTRRTHQ